jgi:hypothetical protein
MQEISVQVIRRTRLAQGLGGDLDPAQIMRQTVVPGASLLRTPMAPP